MTEQLTQAQINELLKSMTHVYSARIQIVLLINSTTYGIDSKCVSLNHKQAMSTDTTKVILLLEYNYSNALLDLFVKYRL